MFRLYFFYSLTFNCFRIPWEGSVAQQKSVGLDYFPNIAGNFLSKRSNGPFWRMPYNILQIPYALTRPYPNEQEWSCKARGGQRNRSGTPRSNQETPDPGSLGRMYNDLLDWRRRDLLLNFYKNFSGLPS